MNVLHSLQGHASGFHELINFLNSLKEIEHLILFGKNSQILGPRYFRPKKGTLVTSCPTDLNNCSNMPTLNFLFRI